MFSQTKMALTSTHHFDSEAFFWGEFLWGVELVCGKRWADGEPGELSNEESMMQTLFEPSSSLRAKMGFKIFCSPVNHRSLTLSYQLPESWSTESLAACLLVFTGVLGEDAEPSSSLSGSCLALCQCEKNEIRHHHRLTSQRDVESPSSLCASLVQQKTSAEKIQASHKKNKTFLLSGISANN